MNILLDECISATHSVTSPKFLKSVNFLGKGAKDSAIIDRAVKLDCIVLTNDFGLVSRLVIRGGSAIWTDTHNKHESDYLIMAMPIEKIQLCDPLTKHLVKNREIIAP